MNTRTMLGWGAGMLLLLLVTQCANAQAVYKCGKAYSDRPCSGARAVDPPPPKRVTRRYEVPPQDRAFAVKRAQLTPQDRKECQGLDVTMREQKMVVKEKGEANVPEVDSALVRNKLRYHELRC